MTSLGIYYLTRLLVTLLAIPCHEAGHALASWLMGDPTARNHGRLSLNPLRHFDLLGTICMVVAGVGWAKPVPTDVRRFKNPKVGMAVTALAGPAANLILAYLSMAVWKMVYYWAPANEISWFATYFLQYMVVMNVGLAVFNLIPVPPAGRQPGAAGVPAAAAVLRRHALRKSHPGGGCWRWCGTAP